MDLLSGTGVATALRIVQWPTLFLTRPDRGACALRVLRLLLADDALTLGRGKSF